MTDPRPEFRQDLCGPIEGALAWVRVSGGDLLSRVIRPLVVSRAVSFWIRLCK